MIPCSRILHKQLAAYFADAQPDGRDVAVLATCVPPPRKGRVQDQQKHSADLPLRCHQTHSWHIFQISKGSRKSQNVLLPQYLNNNYCYSIWAKKCTSATHRTVWFIIFFFFFQIFLQIWRNLVIAPIQGSNMCVCLQLSGILPLPSSAGGNWTSLRQRPCATLEREGGNGARGDGGKEEGW